jgi:RNA polymerase sigma-70 factor (ECF subfamily)
MTDSLNNTFKERTSSTVRGEDGKTSKLLSDLSSNSFDRQREREVVSRAAQGHRESYRELVERYQRRVFTLVNRLVRNEAEAEDLTQDVFVKAYISLKDFKQDSAFYTWIFRIAHNLSLDWLRKNKRRATDSLEEHLGFEPSETVGFSGTIRSPDKELERKEQAQVLMQQFKELSEEHRIAMTLREIDGLSYEEIAEVTGVSRGTVMSRLFYARKKLQIALKEFSPDDGDQDKNGSLVESRGALEITEKLQRQKQKGEEDTTKVPKLDEAGLPHPVRVQSFRVMRLKKNLGRYIFLKALKAV